MTASEKRTKSAERETDSPGIKLMDGRTLHPLPGRVYIRKCMNDHILNEDGSVLLYLDDNSFDGDPLGRGAWCEVIGVGKCRYFNESNIGGFIRAPEMSSSMFRLGSMRDGSEDFCIHEDALMEHSPMIAS